MKKTVKMKQALLAAVVLFAGMSFTAEAAPAEKNYNWNLADSGGFGVNSKFDAAKKELTVKVDKNTSAWAGVNIGDLKFGRNPADLPGWAKGFLVFEIKGGPDSSGKNCNLVPCQIFLANRNMQGKITTSTNTVSILAFAPAKTVPADKFVSVRIPLKNFVWKKGDKTPCNLMLIQYCGNGSKAGGFTVRNMIFEIPEK